MWKYKFIHYNEFIVLVYDKYHSTVLFGKLYCNHKNHKYSHLTLMNVNIHIMYFALNKFLLLDLFYFLPLAQYFYFYLLFIY
jgi:hypothetical protein